MYNFIIKVKSLMHKHYLRFPFFFTSNFEAFTLPYPSVFSSLQLLNNKEFTQQNMYVYVSALWEFYFQGRVQRKSVLQPAFRQAVATCSMY